MNCFYVSGEIPRVSSFEKDARIISVDGPPDEPMAAVIH